VRDGRGVTIAEVEEIVEPGQIDPDQVHLPGVFVQRVFKGTDYQKRIERRTVQKGGCAMLTREQIAPASPASCATAST
jgi:acyl CoA:acetate/3-ketoacid CoA transferase